VVDGRAHLVRLRLRVRLRVRVRVRVGVSSTWSMVAPPW